MDAREIGKFIACLRTEKGCTQQELADKLNISNKTISKWETGRGMPDCALLKPLADILEISVNELLSGEKLALTDSKEIMEKSDEIIVSTLQSKKRIVKIFKILVSVILIVSFILCASLNYLYTLGLNSMAVQWQYDVVNASNDARLVDDNIYRNDWCLDRDLKALSALESGVEIMYCSGEYDYQAIYLAYKEARVEDEDIPIGQFNDTAITDIEREMLIIFFQHKIAIREKYTAYCDAESEKTEVLQDISDRYLDMMTNREDDAWIKFLTIGYTYTSKRSGWTSINYEITPFINNIFSEEGFEIIEDMIEFCEQSGGGCGNFEEHDNWYELKEQYFAEKGVEYECK